MTFLVTAIAQIDALLEAVDKVAVAPVDTAATPITDTPVIEKKQGKKKEKKSKTSVEPSAEVENTADSALNDPFYKCNLRVARIVEVGTIENSDKLYKLKADAGGELLQIVAGLRPYITESEMQDRMVVVVLNLKAAKLAGQLSEAMILAADCPSAEGGLHVATLQPPAGAQPGDPVHMEGAQAATATPKVCKAWAAVVEKLRTDKNHRPTYDGIPLCTSAGPVTVPSSIPDGSSIH